MEFGNRLECFLSLLKLGRSLNQKFNTAQYARDMNFSIDLLDSAEFQGPPKIKKKTFGWQTVIRKDFR